jgi:hypothetical protein
MNSKSFSLLKTYPVLALIVMGVVVLAAVLALVSCGTSTSVSTGAGMGLATVSISDPPSCAAPAGNFSHVYVSIRSVQAHINSTADDNSSGWQELAPQLASHPVQLDLLNLPASGQCLFAILGSTSSLPVGDYQQIRLLLVPNSAPGGPVPASNACASLGQVFNCVADKSNNLFELQLSSQANTGLKVPPGQVVGGPIHVAAGQNVDINLDFNACASIVSQGNGGFRLKPALTAGVVSPNATGLSGQVIDSVTLQPLGGAQVALERQDSSGIDRIIMQATADSNGRFNFCPLPTGEVFDVVIDAINGAAVAYNATVVVNVPSGTALGAVQLVAETGTNKGPGIIQGFVTAVNGTTGAQIDAAMSALQSVPLSGGGSRQFTIPLEQTSTQQSTPTLAVQSSASCPAGSPTGAFCAQYTLVVPASNPNRGDFSAGKITYTAPASGDVLYTVEAKAFKPMSGGAAICTPSTQTTNQDASSAPLKVTAGATVNAKRIDFSSCT